MKRNCDEVLESPAKKIYQKYSLDFNLHAPSACPICTPHLHAPSDFWKFRVVLNQGDSSLRQLFKGGNYSKHKLFYIVRQLFKGGNY